VQLASTMQISVEETVVRDLKARKSITHAPRHSTGLNQIQVSAKCKKTVSKKT